MKTELLEVSPTQKEITIEIEPEEVREVYNNVSKKYAKAVQVDGFRKGYAPLDVIRLRYKEEIKSEVLQELFSPKVGEAIQEFNLNPLSEPHLHIENPDNLKVNGSQPISLRVHVEVMPEIPAPEYKNLEVTRRTRPLSDDELSRIIDERRQESATLIPVEDRKSQDGDTVIVDLEGTFADDENTEPIKADDLEIKLGDANIEKSFTENLNGVEEDEEKEFTVAYAPDFTSPMLAGKTINYKAKIKSVGKVELPELDDDWAQSLDENFESLEDLRSKLREDLKIVAKEEADNRLRSELIAKLIEAHDFEVPSALIDLQARNLLNNFAQDMAGRGVDLNKVDKDFVQMAYTQMQGQAERDVRGAILLEKVAELENVEISDEEVNEEIARMAQYYRTTPEEIRNSLSQQQGGEANIANSLRTRKAVQVLVDHAKITDGEWIDENQPAAEAEEEEKAKVKSKKAKKDNQAVEKKPKAEKKTETKEPKKKAAKKE
ncbi:MAG: trigger factor [Acidobacteria bacterium]|jgi:trigger factor|nr:trigger factor [Acidobacteriota bacterium]